MNDIEYVDVVAVKALPDFCLWVRFSNGREGVRDFKPVLDQGGVMVEPLVGLSAYRRAAGSAAHLACLKAANWADCWVDTRAAMDGTWVGK